MLEKLKQKAISMNFKKTVILFMAISIIFTVTSAILMYTNFNGRMYEMHSVTETQKDAKYQEEDSESPEQKESGDSESNKVNRWDRQRDIKDRERGNTEKEQWEMLDLSLGDKILLGGLGMIAFLLGVSYWILCMIWSYRKSTRLGTNKAFWLVATAFFHLAAIVVLYVYASFSGTCKNCGQLKRRNEAFCSKCGTSTKMECPKCQQVVDESAIYCPNCGKKLK